MKSVDDPLTRKAQLRRRLVEAFMAGDIAGWREATAKLARMLRAEDASQLKDHPNRARMRRALTREASEALRLPRRRPPPSEVNSE
jgi:hypothetical protein